MRLTNTPAPIPNQPPNQPQQIKQTSQTAHTEQTQQLQQTPTTPVIKKPQLKKTKTSLQIQKKQQLSSTQTQQHVTQTIWKKGVVHTEQPPKLNMLKGHGTVDKAKSKEKAKDSEDESSNTISKTSNTEETPNTHKTEQEPVHQQEQEKQLEQPKEQEKEKPKDQEQDKGGRGGGQQQSGQQSGQKRQEQESSESESEDTTTPQVNTNTVKPSIKQTETESSESESEDTTTPQVNTNKPETASIQQSFKAPNVAQPLEGLIADCIRQQEKDLTKAILPSSKREVLLTAQNNVKKMVENAPSDSDLLLHLATKSESDLYVDTIKSMGLLKVKYGEEFTPIISKFETDKANYDKASKIISQLSEISRNIKYENNPELIKQGQEQYAAKLKELDPNLKPVYDQLPNGKVAVFPTVPKRSEEPKLDIAQLKGLLSSKKLDLVESVVTGLKEGRANANNRIISMRDVVDGMVPESFIMNGKTYQFDKLLAQGGGGSVFTYKDTQSGEEVVLKKSNIDPLSVEAMDHHYVKGEHVIEMKAALRSDKGEVFMVLEKATGDLTSVQQRLNQLNVSDPLKEQVALTMISDVLQGMRDIHNQKATHNDMKTGNVYVDKNGTSKVADMGEMKVNDPKVTGDFGTPTNNSPEAMDDNRVADRFKNDVWCTGLMLYGMLNQPNHPFLRPDIQHPVERAKAERSAIVDFGKDPNNRIFTQHPITPVQELINTMMHPDPNQRPTFDMLSKMPIFQDLNPKVKSLIAAVATKDDQQTQSLKTELES